MQRTLTLSQYRNIGLEKPETLVLNHSMEKGKMGELVILIGANNSGKSNVLDAIKSMAECRICDRDITTLSFEQKYLTPSFELGISNTKGEYIKYTVSLNKEAKVDIHLTSDKTPLPTKKELIAEVAAAISFCNQFGITPPKLAELRLFLELNETVVNEELVENVIKEIDAAERFYQTRYGRTNNFMRSMPQNGFWRKHSHGDGLSLDRANDLCMARFGIPFMPNVVVYQERPLTKDDLRTSPSNLNNSLFFASLFKTIGVDSQAVMTAYQQYNSHQNPAILDKLKMDLNKKMAEINKRFNDMYFAENDKYEFSITPSENAISFGMARGKDHEPIMLDFQSTGFKWFFNLFFNFLCSNGLHAGDIIIMDEPATHLHPSGQRELRAFLKEFAHKNDLTFIIATHSPFLVDPDNFDELRVISMDNNRSKIDNVFTAVNHEDPDSLLPIKQALTIEQNVLYNLKTEVTWVEGMLDYNYLTLFKRLLKRENIAFLPFNGVGKNDEAQKDILRRLCQIEFYKRSMLLDGDGAGKKMKSFCKDTCFEDRVMLLSEAFPPEKKIKEIEDLFSSDDAQKYAISLKSIGLSAILKANATLEDFSQETIDNFTALFNRLAD